MVNLLPSLFLIFFFVARTRFLEKQKRVFHSFFVSLFSRGAGHAHTKYPGIPRLKVETLQETLLLPCSLSMYLSTKELQSVAFYLWML
jgi:hypothetical protein